jgi:hypothetical protein
METALDNVTEGLADASELVIDAVLGSEDGMSGGRLRRAIFALLLVGAIFGIVMWRKGQARKASEVTSA